MVQSRCFLCADCEDLGKSGQRNAQGAGSGNGGSLADQEYTSHGAHGFAVSGGVLQYPQPDKLWAAKPNRVCGNVRQSIGRFDYDDGDNVQANSVGSKSDLLTRFRSGGPRSARAIARSLKRTSAGRQNRSQMFAELGLGPSRPSLQRIRRRTWWTACFRMSRHASGFFRCPSPCGTVWPMTPQNYSPLGVERPGVKNLFDTAVAWIPDEIDSSSTISLRLSHERNIRILSIHCPVIGRAERQRTRGTHSNRGSRCNRITPERRDHR